MAETLRADTASGPEAGAEGVRWYACYTRARAEKRVERLLQERGFETFLPLIPRMSQWKDRRKRVEWPLFPSYVFGRFALDDTYRVLSVPGVVTLVKVNGRPVPVDDAELNNVRRFAAALQDGDVAPEPRPYLSEGDTVEVVDGPFCGVRGTVVERRGRRRVLVGLKAIGQGLEVDIDTRLLKTIPSP
jgi:transcription termination/antitermination protein NusG